MHKNRQLKSTTKGSLLLAISLVFAISNHLNAQKKYDLFWVEFTDKNNNPFSLFKPQEYLSKRAVERRLNFGISIEESDLPVNPSYVNAILAQGYTLHCTSKWLNGIVVKSDTLLQQPAQLQQLPFVKKIDALGYSRVVQKPINSIGQRDYKTDYKQRSSYYGNGKNQIQMLNGHYLHQMGYTGKNIHIAILDGGFVDMRECPVFDSLFQNDQILGTHDFVEGDDFVFESSSHGRDVASCMASKLPGVLVGTAPDALYYLFKTEDVDTELRIEEYNWVAAIEEADRLGVDLVNSSLGYYDFDDDKMDYSYDDLNGQTAAISIAANMAAQKGILVVSSAGNEGSSKWKKITVPADAADILTVGAVSRDGYHARFSSYGLGNRNYIKPNLMARGVLSVVAAVGTYSSGYSNGTSFSSPILAGMVASFWQAFPHLNNHEIIAILQEKADNATTVDTVYGYGIPDFFESFKSINQSVVEINKQQNYYISKPDYHENPNLLFTKITSDSIQLLLNTPQGQIIWEGIQQAYNPLNQKNYWLDIPVWNKLKAGVYFLNISIEGTEKRVCIFKKKSFF